MLRTFRLRALGWTAAAWIAASVLYVAALRDDFYALTSPVELSWHVALRKAYSVAAFALIGYLIRRALSNSPRARVVATCIVLCAAYSGAIEIGQYLAGSQEGIVWNATDIGCGALGGALAVADILFRRGARAQSAQRRNRNWPIPRRLG